MCKICAFVLQALIDAGSDVNKKNFFHYTSLLFAAQKGHTDCARALLEYVFS